ncbi:MAG: phosphatidylserine decarboxylase family protein [Balneolaceae bacterium]
MLAPEGYSTIAFVLVISLFTGWLASFFDNWISTTIYILLGALCLLIVFFFRDPDRAVTDDDNLILAPADGKVVQIRNESNVPYINADATRISIFLSPLDVHVNRVPVSGEIEYVEYFPGKYMMAWEDHASEQNERAHFGVLHPSGRKFLFKQITGFLARRIVYHLNEGDSVKAGDRFGIMKFGSRMDVLIPDGIKLKVKEGDRTVAGITVIGELIIS